MTDPQEAATPSDPHSAEALAQAFHENYERLAPSFGYETRKDSAVEWAEVPEPNRSLMIAVAAALIEQVRVSRDAEVAELRAEKERWHDAALIGLAQESAARSEVAELKAKIADAVARLHAASIPLGMTESQFDAATIRDTLRILLGSASSPVEGGN